MVAPIDLEALRAERERRLGHDMRAHLRTEAYPYLNGPQLRPADGPISTENLEKRIRDSKSRLSQ